MDNGEEEICMKTEFQTNTWTFGSAVTKRVDSETPNLMQKPPKRPVKQEIGMFPNNINNDKSGVKCPLKENIPNQDLRTPTDEYNITSTYETTDLENQGLKTLTLSEFLCIKYLKT